MSFTSTVKEEVCKLDLPILENIAELAGFSRSNCKYTDDMIEFSTENSSVANRIKYLLNDIYGVDPVIEERSIANFNSKKMYVVILRSKVNQILKDLSVIDEFDEFMEVPKDYIIGSIDEAKAYIRGSFLAKGSINDPMTSQYHLEFSYENKHEAVFVQRLLNQFDMNSKIITRDVKYMVYIKEAEKISDFLKVISAIKAVLYYEEIRIHKEQKNITNRLNNCEQANTDKMFATASEQLKEIDLIDELMGIDLLDDKLKETCIYRRKYPEVSLSDLSKIMTEETGKSVTKSGINHRFRKIKEIATRLKQNSK